MNDSDGDLVEVEKVFVDILQNGMNLSDQNVWINTENINIPETDELFVTVGVIDSQILTSTRKDVATDSGIKQVFRVVQRENVQIDIMSSTSEARRRRSEILFSLQSVYATQKQELYKFKIGSIPTSFVNASENEGARRLNRFAIVVPCLVWYYKENNLLSGEYYDNFSHRVDVEETIDDDNGMIEFNIP